MKPHLPRALRLALAACFAMLPGYTLATTNWADIVWEPDEAPWDHWSRANVVGDIQVSSDVDMTGKTLTWDTNSGTATMSGEATISSVCRPVHIDIDDETSIDDCTCGLLEIAPRQNGTFHYTIESGIASDGVDWNFNSVGWTEGELTVDFKGTLKGSDIDKTIISLGYMTLDLTEATIINGAGGLDFFMYDGGTTLRIPEFEVNALRTLSMQGIMSESPATLRGNLTLNANSALLPDKGHLDFNISANEGAAFPTLTVTGTLSIVSTTTVSFSTFAFNAEEKTNYYIPSGDTVIMRVGDLSGNLRNLLAYSLLTVYDQDDTYDAPAMALEDKMFTSRPTADGYEILLVDATPTSTVISDGVAEGALGETLRIDFGTEGGTVDAKGVTEGLNSDNVLGQSGTLLTSAEQTLELLGTSSIGYSIIGSEDAVSCGAALVMNGDNALLSGTTYNVQSVSINSGTLELSKSSLLRTASGSTIDVSGALVNLGHIESNLQVNAGASVDHQGQIWGDVAVSGDGATLLSRRGEIYGTLLVENGATLSGSGSISGNSTIRQAVLSSTQVLHIGGDAITLDNATLSFTLDGLHSAQSSATEGLYSQMIFSGGDLTILNGLTIQLHVTENFINELLAISSVESLNLIETTGLTSCDSFADAELVFVGSENDILKNLSLGADGMLTFTAPSQEPETPIVISSGVATGALGETQSINFGTEGGTVDAKGVTEGLNTDNVLGQSGTLLTSAEQTLELRGTSNIGYSITGSEDAVSCGAALVMNGDNALLSGTNYNVQSVSINSGTLELSKSSLLRTASGSTIDVSGALVNLGHIESNLQVNAGASVDHQGQIWGDVAVSGDGATLLSRRGEIYGTLLVENGATLSGSGSISGNSTIRQAVLSSTQVLHIGGDAITLDNATLSFTLDGLHSAQSSATEGLYSQMIFSGGDLTILNGLTIQLHVTENFVNELLAISSVESLNLIETTGLTSCDSFADAELVFVGSENDILKNLSLGADGMLTFTAPSQDPETPPTISDGTAEGSLGETLRIDFGTQGGTVDATGVTDGLNSNNVQGQSGTLLTSSEQTMKLSGLDYIGYNITGVEGATGAALQMDGKLVTLEGQNYQVQSVSINKGILQVSEDTQLSTATSEDGGIKLSAETGLNNYGTITADVTLATGAFVDNRGSITGDVTLTGTDTGKTTIFANNNSITGDVTLTGTNTIFANNSVVEGDTQVTDGALVQGNGTFTGTTLFQNATMHIGNSPGRMTYTGDTTLDNATLEFTLNGLRASQGANDTVGTYSTVVFTGGELTIQNGLSLVLAVEDNFIAELLNSGDRNIQLGLINIDGVTNTGTDLDELKAALSNAMTTVTGNLSEVLQELDLDDSGKLTATINQGLLAALVSDNGSDLANTMWSSARTLASFAATSKAQLAQVPEGKTHAWVSALGSHVDIGGTRGFRYNGGGAVVGVAQGFGGGLSAGLSLGQSKGTFKSDGGKVRDEQETTMLGLYGQYLWQTPGTRHGLAVYAAYGCSDNDADTQMAASPAKASWDDETLHLGAQYRADIALSDSLSFTPFLSLEYTHVSQDDITERSGALAAHYSDGSMENLSIAPGVTLRKSIALGTTQRLLPELTLAYVGDVVRDDPSLNRRSAGYRAHATGSKVGRHALMLRAGSYWAINEQVTLDAFYTLETREHECSQGANLGVSVDF